jgi:hypothetical protein
MAHQGAINSAKPGKSMERSAEDCPVPRCYQNEESLSRRRGSARALEFSNAGTRVGHCEAQIHCSPAVTHSAYCVIAGASSKCEDGQRRVL